MMQDNSKNTQEGKITQFKKLGLKNKQTKVTDKDQAKNKIKNNNHTHMAA